ncbi:hypothetical protein [Acidovorax sp. FHTAMBA]|jgi:hypothetical protein|uniref:hypothetical protein n=1 Tax=Acidovorax sp. FHTAMBA TaxID=3140252 RepID=UPI0031830583
MQLESKKTPIEFRTRISIHYEECPALWEAFNNIPKERWNKAVLVMLARLKTLEKGGEQAEAAAVQSGKNQPVEVAPLAEPVPAPFPSPSPVQVAISQNLQEDDDIAGLLDRFGEGGLDAYLGITQ